jgi:hypothetical protein
MGVLNTVHWVCDQVLERRELIKTGQLGWPDMRDVFVTRVAGLRVNGRWLSYPTNQELVSPLRKNRTTVA